MSRLLIHSMTEPSGNADMGNGGGGSGNGGGGDPGAGEGGVAAPEWVGSLSEELQGNEVLKGIASVEDLAKGYLDADGRLKDTSAPESPDGYDFDVTGFDEKTVASMRSTFHQIGMTKAQAAKAVELVKADVKRAEKDQKEALEKAIEQTKAKTMAALRDGSGAEEAWKDKTDANIAAANQAVVRFFGKEFAEFMRSSGLGNNELYIRGMHKIATMIKEDTSEGDAGGGGDGRPRRADGAPMFEFKNM